ncbi:MAG: T9SS type A sorting domain-containing protein, partial [Cyclobacteriaceae bacterium]
YFTPKRLQNGVLQDGWHEVGQIEIRASFRGGVGCPLSTKSKFITSSVPDPGLPTTTDGGLTFCPGETKIVTISPGMPGFFNTLENCYFHHDWDWTVPGGWKVEELSEPGIGSNNFCNGCDESVKVTAPGSVTPGTNGLYITIIPESPFDNWIGTIQRQITVGLPSNVSISGDTWVSTTNKNYSLQNIPSGHTVTWSVSPSYLVNSASGSGTTASFRAKTSTSSGQATLIFTVNGSCASSATFNHTLWVGPPDYNNLELNVDGGELSNCDYTYADADYDHPAGPSLSITEYEWRIPYSSDWDIYEEYGGFADFQYVEIEYWDSNPPSQEAIQIRARNTSGWSLWKEFWVDVDDCGGYYMMMSPNPSTDYVEISFQNSEKQLSSKVSQSNKILEKDVITKIYDQQHNEIFTCQSRVSDGLTIDTSNIQPGHYIIKVYMDENIFSRHLSIE